MCLNLSPVAVSTAICLWFFNRNVEVGEVFEAQWAEVIYNGCGFHGYSYSYSYGQVFSV